MQAEWSKLMQDVRKRLDLVSVVIATGGATRELEVDRDCYVQILQYTGQRWLYHQVKVDQLPQYEQGRLIGMFHNEAFGDLKIIGIYKIILTS